jgi:hypothetical protein
MLISLALIIKKPVTMEVTYTNGDKDTFTRETVNHYCELKNGCARIGNMVMACDVRTIKRLK